MTVNGVYMLGNIKGDVRECLGAISKHNPTSTMKIWYMITMEMLVADNGKKIRHFIDFSSDHMTLKKPLLEFQETRTASNNIMTSLGKKMMEYSKSKPASFGKALEFRIMTPKM